MREKGLTEAQTVINEKELALDDWENSRPIWIAKDEKACSKENTKVVARPHFVEEVRCVTPGSNRPTLAEASNRERVI